MDAVAPIDVEAHVRTSEKRRRKELLASKWYCQYCKHYTEREVEGAPVLKCSRRGEAIEPLEYCCMQLRDARLLRDGRCGIDSSAGSLQETEALRLKSREKRAKGRALNQAGAGAAAAVERQAAGILDDERERERAVERDLCMDIV